MPAINVNDSITKSKNDNKYGCRHGLDDAIKRGTDMLLSGKKALVIGYGDVGKGSADSLNQQKMIVDITEIDPICAMQACMDGFSVVSCYKDGVVTRNAADINMQVMGDTDLVVTTTGNVNVCDSAMLSTLKNTAVVCNIGHFDNEIDMTWLNSKYGNTKEEIKPQVDKYTIKDNHIIVLAEGRLVNLGCATGHPTRSRAEGIGIFPQTAGVPLSPHAGRPSRPRDSLRLRPDWTGDCSPTATGRGATRGDRNRSRTKGRG